MRARVVEMTRFTPHWVEWDPKWPLSGSPHLQILRQGAPEWNKWRRENPNVVPFLVGLLPGVEDLDLSGADLSGSILYHASFRRTNLSKSNFAWVTSWECNFSDCDLDSAFIEDARFRFANFVGCKLTRAIMTRAEVVGQLVNSDLTAARLGASKLDGWWDGVRLCDCDLSNAVLRNLRLSRVSFKGTGFNQTAFLNVTFEACDGLDQVIHLGPSEFSVSTIQNNVEIPPEFWEAAGVKGSISDAIVKFGRPSVYHSCFISFCLGR